MLGFSPRRCPIGFLCLLLVVRAVCAAPASPTLITARIADSFSVQAMFLSNDSTSPLAAVARSYTTNSSSGVGQIAGVLQVSCATCDVFFCDPWHGFHALGQLVAVGSSANVNIVFSGEESSGPVLGDFNRLLALCGYLGGGGSTTVLVSVDLYEANDKGSANSSNGSSLVGSAIFNFEMSSSVPVTAEIDSSSAFCVPGFFLRTNVPAPALDLLMFDAWGNVAQFMGSGPAIATASSDLSGVAIFSASSIVNPGDTNMTFRNIVPTLSTHGQPSALMLGGLGPVVLGTKSKGCQSIVVATGRPQVMTILPASNQAVEPINASSWLVAVRHDAAFTVVTYDVSGLETPSQPINCTAANGTVLLQLVGSAHSATATNGTSFVAPTSTLAVGMTMTVNCEMRSSVGTGAVSMHVVLLIAESGETNCFRPTSDAVAFGNALTAATLHIVHAVLSAPQTTTIIPFTQLTIVAPLQPSLGTSPGESVQAAVSTYLALPAEYAQWIIVPDQEYLNIPLGLLRALAFGSSYSVLQRVTLELNQPICQSADLAAWRVAVSLWMYSAGFNATNVVIKAIESNAFNQQINVCSGSGLASLEFVKLSCCDSGGACASRSTDSVLAIVLLVLGVFVGIANGLGTVWYLWLTAVQFPVRLSDRRHMSLAAKWRIFFAHMLAPFVCLAHCYFIFDSLQTKAGTTLFSFDVLVSSFWYLGAVIRMLFPLNLLASGTYFVAASTVILYTQFLLAQAVVWSLSAIHIDIRVVSLTFCCLLVSLQLYWAIRAGSVELEAAFSKLKKKRTSSAMYVRSTVPVDIALSLELFTITVMLYMFAVTQVQDITPFLAIAAAFVAFGYSFLYNYSVSNQIQSAIRRFVGIDDNFKAPRSNSVNATSSNAGSAGGTLLEKLIYSHASQRGFKEDVETALSGALSTTNSIKVPLLGSDDEGHDSGRDDEDDDLGFMYSSSEELTERPPRPT